MIGHMRIASRAVGKSSRLFLPFREARDFIKMFWRYRHLIFALSRKELTDRYAGQLFGLMWLFLHPALVVSVYLFLFGFVLKSKVAFEAMGLSYPIYLLSGLLPWLGFVEGMNRWAVAITSKASLVKQVVFPIEILPIINVIVPLFTQAIMMGLFIVFISATSGLHLGLWLLPLAVAVQVLQMLGLAYLLSAAGVYFKDLKDFVQVFTSLGVYLAPIVYMPGMLPTPIAPLVNFNPFTHMVRCFRDAFEGTVSFKSWGISLSLGIILFVLGWRTFRRTRPYFGSAI